MNMSDMEKATSGAKTEASGSVEQDVTSSGVANGMYPETFVNKLKKEKENLLKAVAEAKAEAAKVKAELEQKSETELASQMQYKQLWENEKQSKIQALEALKETQEKINEGKKVTAIRQELSKLGILPEHLDTAFRLMDLKAINLDPATEQVVGADDAAKSFYEKYNALGFFNKMGMKANHQAPAMGKSVVDFEKLGYAEKLKALKERVQQK